MKHKHNKNKNIAFLYNILIKEMASSHIKKDTEKSRIIGEMIKTHFPPNSLLRKELRLFNHLIEKVCEDEQLAEKIIVEAKRQYSLLPQDKLTEKRQDLFFKMKKNLTPESFKHFVPNYRTVASIYQIFNGVSARQQIVLESEVKTNMIKESDEKLQLEPIDDIVIKEFVRNFNEEYSSLLEEQKDLIGTYITSFIDNGIDLKIKASKHIKEIKSKLTEAKNATKDKDIKKGLEQILQEVESFKNKPIDEKILTKLLKAHNILQEVRT